MSDANYTANEKRLLEILRKANGNELTYLEIAEKHYLDGKARPKFARQSVVCVLNALAKKTQRNKGTDGFVVKRSDRAGPHPNIYWLETSDRYFKKLIPLFKVETPPQRVEAMMPSSSKVDQISMELSSTLKARLEDWIARQDDSLSPQEAIERVLNNYLPGCELSSARLSK